MLGQSSRVRYALADLDVVVRQDMGKNIHGRCGNYLVEAESEIRFEPSPEQPIEFVKDEKRDKERPKQSNNCGRNCAIGQNGGDYRRQDTKRNCTTKYTRE